MSKPIIGWVSLGSWGLGVKWYSGDRILAIQLGSAQFEVQFRSLHDTWR